MAEVASHRYSDRKDELTAIDQEAIQRRHDEDMARVQHDAAQAIERAAHLEKDAAEAKVAIADANLRAAEATRKAVEAQLALEKYRAPRILSAEQRSDIVSKLQPLAGTKFDLAMAPGDPEAFVLLRQLAEMLEAASWTWIEFNHPNGPFMTVAQYGDKPNIGYLTWAYQLRCIRTMPQSFQPPPRRWPTA
jgi:hypothetical protein